MQVIRLDQSKLWDEIITSFSNYDVYYLSGYVAAFKCHGDGDPILLYHNSSEGRGVCVLMIRDVAEDPLFENKIPKGVYFDAVTPYGYGGFIYDGYVDKKTLASDFTDALKRLNVNSVFFRFHPVLSNADSLANLIQVIELGRTISCDLSSLDIIWSNITSKNRNMIRKAEKAGVIIKHGKDFELLKKFIDIYNGTMDHDNADKYYYFEMPFYESIYQDLGDNFEIFYAEYEGNIIAASIMIYANGKLNYHLSGSKYEYRNLAPSNLLLYKAALWGNSNGMSSFHLGGGLGSGEDSLYKFKAAFNRNSDCRFAIGKAIIDNNAYEYLLSLRNFTESESISFFPQYRARLG